jgi:LPXTG-motif cell wall-anchored protein
MPAGARPAALAAILACLVLAASAGAAQRPPQLVAQMAQAAPTATPGGEPQLSDQPPTKLGSGSKSRSNSGTKRRSSTSSSSSAKPLPQTGSDAAMYALAGFALLGWGVALRLRLRDAA